MIRPHYLNGRILLRERGGVYRYAREIADRLAVQILQPARANRPWSGRVWEQTALARRASAGVLLNVAHGGPLRHPRQVNVIHDLLALTDPASVHPAYAALTQRQLPAHVASASKVVTVSAHVADQIANRFAIDRSTIEVVPPGIAAAFVPGDQTTARIRLSLERDGPVVAALLDPTPRKNSAAVACALREVQRARPDVQIVVAGASTAPAFGRRRTPFNVDRTGFLDLGAATDVDVATMYQAADVFLSLTSGEGFGLPVIEAAACGAAVVTTAVPSIVEHAPDGAVIVSDESESTAAVIGLLEDPARRGQLTVRCQQLLGDLHWDRTAASLGVIMSEVGHA